MTTKYTEMIEIREANLLLFTASHIGLLKGMVDERAVQENAESDLEVLEQLTEGGEYFGFTNK